MWVIMLGTTIRGGLEAGCEQGIKRGDVGNDKKSCEQCQKT